MWFVFGLRGFGAEKIKMKSAFFPDAAEIQVRKLVGWQGKKSSATTKTTHFFLSARAIAEARNHLMP